jgi:hypothetical protein
MIVRDRPLDHFVLAKGEASVVVNPPVTLIKVTA